MHRVRLLFGKLRPDPSQRLPRDVIVLGVIAFFVMVGFGVVVPVLPVYVRSFGVGYVEVGAVVSAFALVRLVASPFCGWLIKRGGERTILAIGMGIVAVSSGLVGVAETYAQVLVLRGLGGVGSAMFTISAMTLLLGTTPPHLRGRSMGFYQGGFLVGGMAGPALGGVLAVISLEAPFFFYAGTLTIAGIVGLVLLQPRTLAVAGGDAEPPVPFRMVARDPRFIAACLANLAQGWSSFGVRSALVPVLVVDLLNRPPVWTGIAFAVSAVAQTIALAPAGKFVDTVGRRPAIIGAYAVGGLAMIAIPFAPDIWMLILLLSVYGVASSFMGTAPAAAVGDAAGGRGGHPVAVFSAFSDLGAIIGPLVAGALVDAVSYPAAFATAVVLMFVASAFGLRMPREQRSATPTAAS